MFDCVFIRPDDLLTNIVTWRGMITKMLCSPYNKSEPWKVAATLYNGTIYLSEIETEEAKERTERQTPREQQYCYWGVKFEDYMTVKGMYVRLLLLSKPKVSCVIMTFFSELFLCIPHPPLLYTALCMSLFMSSCNSFVLRTPHSQQTRHFHPNKQEWNGESSRGILHGCENTNEVTLYCHGSRG